ncbi:hypothetical protein HMPREF1544_11494 [Mucor circinelloides 1006PhL]|uniref:Transcriptional regulatory protein DEP1 n=1 Tax=Mucor circinelloides f. circinelloides (strain 1006PhL) TaxID=1220926 RepID=S2JPU3_MUCC1|nr:hypothetical protein HMPREF1544_11494 [Mucor circinelloides 1006PhL]
MDNNTTTTEENARQSSKLSLGSSPSVLSADEQLEGDGPLTPIDKMQDDVEDDDDDLSALNSILQAGSPGSLSDEEEEDDDETRMSEGDDDEEEDEDEDEDDLQTEQDSASPLSSVPDDFPLSRSASPDLPLVEKLQQDETEADGEDEDEDEDDGEEEEEEEETAANANTTTTNISTKEEEENDDNDDEEQVEEKVMPKINNRKLSMTGNLNAKKRRKEDTKKKVDPKDESDSEHSPSPPKKAKPSEASTTKESSKNTDTSSSSEDTIVMNNTKKRRVSRSTLEISEAPRTRRRQSRQEELIAKTEIEQVVEKSPVAPQVDDTATESMNEDAKSGEKEIPVGAASDENEKDTDNVDNQEDRKQEPVVTEQDESMEGEEAENGQDSEEHRGNHEAQDNDDHDYQHRHQEALDALTHIEIEFARLRDKMYQEKMAELHDEARMIANGTHPELVTLLAEIEEKKGKRIHSAEAWRKYQHDNFRQQFEGLEYQANIHFISQKNALRRDLLSKINGKRWNMEDERTKLNDPARGERVFPDGRELVAHKREQKEETGELQDIKEAVGFPMAPNPSGLSIQDVDDDLKLLGIKHS